MISGPHFEVGCNGYTGSTFYRCEICGSECIDKERLLHKGSCSLRRRAVGTVQ